MLSLCTPVVAHAMMYFSLALVAIAFGFQILTHFNRQPGSIDLWDIFPVTTYWRFSVKPSAHLTPQGQGYWKLCLAAYSLAALITVLGVYAYAPSCVAAIEASAIS